MTWWGILAAGLFLPLFPLSMVFNLLFARVTWPVARAVLLLAWPMAGLLLLDGLAGPVPDAVVVWAVVTSLLYAVRMLAMREFGTWTGFLATSQWALLWIAAREQIQLSDIVLEALGFSIPLVFLVLVALMLTRRFGGAYAGLGSGIAISLPRLSVVLVIGLLASVATPPFPGFFTLLWLLLQASPVVMIGLLVVWLFWSWAAVRLIQGFIAGDPARDSSLRDISSPLGWVMVAAFSGLILVDALLIGALL